MKETIPNEWRCETWREIEPEYSSDRLSVSPSYVLSSTILRPSKNWWELISSLLWAPNSATDLPAGGGREGRDTARRRKLITFPLLFSFPSFGEWRAIKKKGADRAQNYLDISGLVYPYCCHLQTMTGRNTNTFIFLGRTVAVTMWLNSMLHRTRKYPESCLCSIVRITLSAKYWNKVGINYCDHVSYRICYPLYLHS